MMNEENYFNSLSIHFCGMEECSSGHSFGPAVRNQYLLHYIISGNGTYEVGGTKYNLSAGELFLIKPSELTFYHADEKEPWTYMWVAFDGYEVKKILKECGIDYVLRVENQDEFSKNLKELIYAYNNENYNEYRGFSLFYGMISGLVQRKESFNENFHKNYYKKAVSYILNNFINPITVQEIADHVGIERTYLYKIFMENASVSPKKYLMNIRIQSAIKLLLMDEFTQSQIASSTGFRDAQSFCKYFKNANGVTPGNYKKMTKRYGEHGISFLENNI